MRQSLSTKQKLVLLALVLLIAAGLAVIQWASIKRGELTGPGAMAVDAQGRLWLNINRVLFIIDPNGNIVREIDLAGAGIAPPIADMAPFRNGEMLVGSRISGHIYRVSTQGNVLGRLDTNSEPAWKPFGSFHLAYQPVEHNIVITDASNHRVLLLDELGNLLRESGAPQGGSPSYRFPNGVIINNAGDIVVVDTNNHRVLTLNGSLEMKTTWISDTFSARYRYPVFIAQAPNGDFYLTIHDNRLDYAEVVRLNERGERQDTVAFKTNVIPNGLVADSTGVLLADMSAQAIWRIQDNGRSVSRLGGPQLLGFLRETRETKAFYDALVAGCQGLLIALLLVMLVVALIIRVREQKRDMQTGLPVENAAIPPRQNWATFKQSVFLLPILLLPTLLALSLLVQIYGLCTLDTLESLKALSGNVIVLLPWIGLVWLCRHGYRRGILRGRYHQMFVRRAYTLLNRHRAALAGALAPGERILGAQMAVLQRRPALIAISNEMLWVMTLSLFGIRVRRIQAVALAAITEPKVVEETSFRSYVRFLGLPMWQLQFASTETQYRYAIELPDGYGASRMAEYVAQLASLSTVRTGSVVRDAACPNCVEPGQNVTVATLLGVIFPGLGQFYAEEMYKGVVYLLSGGFLVLTLLEPLVAFFYRTEDISWRPVTVTLVMLMTLWVFALVDAIITTRRNRTNRVGVLALQ